MRWRGRLGGDYAPEREGGEDGSVLARTELQRRASDGAHIENPSHARPSGGGTYADLQTIAEGKHITRDLGGKAGTKEYTDAILAKLNA